MSGQNQQFGARSGRFENLDCPVEAGEPCVMPNHGRFDGMDCQPEPDGSCVKSNRRGWHIDKGLNPVYIVPLVGAILAGLAWAGTVNSGQDVQNQRLNTVEKKVDDVIIVSREDMKEINRKLDRLIERGK